MEDKEEDEGEEDVKEEEEEDDAETGLGFEMPNCVEYWY